MRFAKVADSTTNISGAHYTDHKFSIHSWHPACPDPAVGKHSKNWTDENLKRPKFGLSHGRFLYGMFGKVCVS